MRGFVSRERMKFDFGIPIQGPLAYSALMQKIQQINVGNHVSKRNTVHYLTQG